MHATVHKTFTAGSFKHPAAAESVSHLKPDPAGELVHLQGPQFLRLHRAAGWTLRVLAGTAWITQDHDLRDIVLQAGESFVLDRDGDALVSPLKEVKICIQHDTVADKAVRKATAHRLTLRAEQASPA
ncbi:MAG TPA: DUF2917 domain-containing protein [Noviherbaspirillum sp.]|uniref:DUF2917 domain-containing protein n=1 Tax=Noviherbaspirillum sp. TaxID=1926288 RepID=UPI002B48410B|nr:DUF2917 domain-containing protein [Noviherbaspirillum sp.]HJV84328.1 DUF2917 domain-containing protein [Noviherbaspirillum sp.]